MSIVYSVFCVNLSFALESTCPVLGYFGRVFREVLKYSVHLLFVGLT